MSELLTMSTTTVEPASVEEAGVRRQRSAVSGKARLMIAFWSLLETHSLAELTVGMIAKEAQCNRGTFYYHYNDLDELIQDALFREVRGEHNLPAMLFELISGTNGSATAEMLPRMQMYLIRLILLMEHGGRDLVEAHVKHFVLDIWETVLCADGSTLQPETRLLIEFYVGGVLGCLTYLYRRPDEEGEYASELLLQAIPPFILEQIASFQGISESDLVVRLKLASMMSSTEGGPTRS